MLLYRCQLLRIHFLPSHPEEFKSEVIIPGARESVSHRAALISVPIALSQTPAEAAIPRTRSQCVAWSACLASSLRRYQFILLGEQRQ